MWAATICCVPACRAESPAAPEVPAADSSAAWLPLPIEDVPEPDRLEADPLRGAGSLRLERREDRLRVRHVALNARSASRSGGMAWIARDGSPVWISAIAARSGGSGRAGTAAAGGLGALVIRDAPPLFAGAMEWSRTTRRPSAPIVSGPTFEAPPSPASAAILGGALATRAQGMALWAVAGRREADHARLAAVGFAARPGGPLACAIALGAVRPGAAASAGDDLASGGATGRAASVSARADDGSRSLATELLIERGRGPTAAVEVVAKRGPTGLVSRWRRRPGESRPVAAEWIATAEGARCAARVTWRPWTSRATGDDGTLEAEGTLRIPGAGPARLRIGWKPGGEDPESPRERYALLDLVIAAERGRSLALLASRRERRTAGVTGTGATLGGRLALAARGRAALTLVIESARTGSAAGAAWTTGLTPSGESALVTRGRSSVAVSARGWVRIGAMRLRALLRDASSGPGTDGAPVQATMWLEWSG